MDILCPVCKFKGSISDDLIPESGKRVACPRCRASIFIRKPVISLTAGKSKGSSPGRPAGNSSPVPVDTDTRVIRARCENCGGEIKVPENKKMVLCPGCGANIVRQVVEEELEPGFIEYSVEAIGQSFRSVFKGWGTFLKRRRVRRVLGAVLALLALSLLFYGIDRGRQSPDGFLNKKIDITFNSPASGDGASTDSRDGGFLGNLIQIRITSRDEQDKEEVRVYQLVFKDGTRSGYFRYYRHDRGLVYIMLPDGGGGSYELGYEDDDIRSIKRIRKVPGDARIFGVN